MNDIGDQDSTCSETPVATVYHPVDRFKYMLKQKCVITQCAPGGSDENEYRWMQLCQGTVQLHGTWVRVQKVRYWFLFQ